MAKRGVRLNRQLVVAIILVVVAAVGWIAVRRHEAVIIEGGDASACWTASCRDAVVQSNYDRTAPGAKPDAVPDNRRP